MNAGETKCSCRARQMIANDATHNTYELSERRQSLALNNRHDRCSVEFLSVVHANENTVCKGMQ